MEEQWENPEFRAKMRKKKKKQMKDLWENPEFRAKMSEKKKKQMKDLWENPEFRAKMSEKKKKKQEESLEKKFRGNQNKIEAVKRIREQKRTLDMQWKEEEKQRQLEPNSEAPHA